MWAQARGGIDGNRDTGKGMVVQNAKSCVPLQLALTQRARGGGHLLFVCVVGPAPTVERSWQQGRDTDYRPVTDTVHSTYSVFKLSSQMKQQMATLPQPWL